MPMFLSVAALLPIRCKVKSKMIELTVETKRERGKEVLA